MNINKPTGIKVGFGAMAVKGIIIKVLICPFPGLFLYIKPPELIPGGLTKRLNYFSAG